MQITTIKIPVDIKISSCYLDLEKKIPEFGYYLVQLIIQHLLINVDPKKT